MARLRTTLRRSLWLVLIAAAGGAVWTWRRDAADATSPAPATWPPLAEPAGASTPPAASPTPDTSPTPTSSTASIVNALVDAPEARSRDQATGGWAEPLADGSAPAGYSIKANDNSGIFHVPGGRFYDRTKAERYYSDADAAIADGYRQAKN